MSYTPGPWKWWTSNSWKRLKRDHGGLVPRDSVLAPYVCRDGQPDIEVSEADMRLIAAAPLLYESLKEAVRALELVDAETAMGLYVDFFGMLSNAKSALALVESGK